VFDNKEMTFKTRSLDFSQQQMFYKVSFDTDDIIIEDLPFATQLEANFPNPFNPSTTIRYSLNQFENVKLTIYNVRGQLVKTLVYGFQEAGRYAVVWQGDDSLGNPVSSGVYFYRLETTSSVETRRMLLLR